MSELEIFTTYVSFVTNFSDLLSEYNSAQAEFLTLDPSLGKRKRKAMTIQINEMVEQMDKKADQIYALYDVAELVCEDR